MNLDQYGRSQAAVIVRNYYESVASGRPLAKGMLLRGQHGVGKTSLVHAIVETYGCELAETNASMDRDKHTFNRLINAGLTGNLGGQRVLFFDEADGLTASQQKRLARLLEVVKCPVFIATNSPLEKELQDLCMLADVRPVRGEQSHRLTKMVALGGEKLEHADEPEERIKQALMGGGDDLPPSDWWMVSTTLLDNTRGSEPMAWDLWQGRYRRVGSDMAKYAQRALRLNLKGVERPWSLKLRWGGPKQAKKVPAKAPQKPQERSEPAPSPKAPPKATTAPAEAFF